MEGASMRSVLLTEVDSLDRIGAIWTELWERTQPLPPTLELEWVRQWWRLHGAEGQLQILLVMNDDRQALGIAPLYRRHDRGGPRRYLRSLHLLGTGEREADEVTGEYTSWLCAPEAMAQVSAEVAAHLLKQMTPGWDLLRLEKLRPEAAIHEHLPRLLARGMAASATSEHACFRSPALPLEQYLAALPSASFRHRCRRALRAGRDAGVELVRGREPGEVAGMFAALRSLHQQRWTGRGLPGAFASDVFNRFHDGLLEPYRRDEKMWMMGLRRQGQWLAVRYLLRAGDTLYDYLSGVDTATETALAPGLLLHLLSIDAAATAGIRTYDLMAGDQEYKRRLALEESALPTLELHARTMRARLWLAAREMRRDLAQVRAMATSHGQPPADAPGAAPPAEDQPPA
jgi:CelD/BcsL family acetyltransferase involved in cellulose biosynthesis